MAKIQWPIGPTQGDIYTSPNGDHFKFEGCAWLHTCCITSCNIQDGLIAVVSVNAVSVYGTVNTVTYIIALTYNLDNNTWTHLVIAGLEVYELTFLIHQSYGSWILEIVGNDSVVLGTNSGVEPVGSWEVSQPGLSVDTYCGISDNQICAQLLYGYSDLLYQQFSLSPFVFGLDYNAPVSGYATFIGIWVAWDTNTNQWIIFGQSGVFGNLPDVAETSLPIGEWVLNGVIYEGLRLVTTQGLCSTL